MNAAVGEDNGDRPRASVVIPTKGRNTRLAFALDVLEVLEVRPELTPAEIRADLATLEELWREKLDPATLY